MEASPKHTSPGLGSGAMASRMLMVQPDPVLCKLCARGSDDAFSVLHARYRQQVFAFVYHLLDRPGATDDAEDITQEVFSKAYTSIRTKNAEGSFKHWLFAIARNRTFDVIRARKPNSLPLEQDDESTELRAVGGSPAQAVETKQELAWLVGTVSSLPERQREALVMRELAGMSHAEIADALETSVPATKQLISRGRESVQAAATENGYRSRKLGRELAMAAPLLPFVAFSFGASASSASAATAGAAAGTATSAAAASSGAATAGGAAGIGGLAVGTKIVATVAAVAVVGGGAVATERVVTGSSAEPTAAVSKTGATTGGPNANASQQAFISVAEARERKAAAKKKAAAKRAKAKAKAKKRRAKAKSKAKAKREKVAKRKELNANANSGGSGSTNSKAQSNGGGSGGSGTSEQPASSGGGNSGGSGGDSAGGGSGGNAGGGGNSGGGNGGGNGGGKP